MDRVEYNSGSNRASNFKIGQAKPITPFITCRAKLLNTDWLRQGAFFLNQKGTFGNQEGMIT